MLKPENKKKSAHYLLEKKKSLGNKQIRLLPIKYGIYSQKIYYCFKFNF